MIHVREDYNRIQDPAGLIPDDEPVMLLRAQDALALETLYLYLRACEMANIDRAMIHDLIIHMGRFALWIHRKLPDYPPHTADPDTPAQPRPKRTRKPKPYVNAKSDDPSFLPTPPKEQDPCTQRIPGHNQA